MWRQACPHLAHELFPVGLSQAVGLQLDVGHPSPRSGTSPCGGGRQGQLCARGDPGLVIGPLDPVAPKLGQQDEGEGAGTTQNLSGTPGIRRRERSV